MVMRCRILLGLGFAIGALAVATLVHPSATQAGTTVLPTGEYLLTALRRASDAAGGPTDATVTVKLGDRVRFGTQTTWIDGTECKDAKLIKTGTIPHEEMDPNLSDLGIGPIDAAHSAGEQRVNQILRLTCQGKDVGTFRMLDRRVLILRSKSGLTHMIYAKPLTGTQIKQLQAQLKSMKFYSGTPSTTWDKESQRALADFAEYRGAKFRFLNPVITENLLDGLRVLAN